MIYNKDAYKEVGLDPELQIGAGQEAGAAGLVGGVAVDGFALGVGDLHGEAAPAGLILEQANLLLALHGEVHGDLVVHIHMDLAPLTVALLFDAPETDAVGVQQPEAQPDHQRQGGDQEQISFFHKSNPFPWLE